MISQIKIWPLKQPHKTIKANVQFVINNAWKVKGTLMTGEKGLFVGLPGKYSDKTDEKTGKKIWYPDISCIDHEEQRQLNEAVIAEYNKLVGNKALDQGSSPSGPTDQTKQNIPFG